MKKIKIAYLPLYIKLYDDSVPQERGPMEAYMRRLIAMIEERGFEVVPADGICRVREEFDRAVLKFTAAPEIAAVVTQHLAYSPSLESIGALLSLRAPLIVLDTTPDYELVRAAGTENRIMPNHGIHGVQDMCSMLRRNGRSYEICAGHALHSGVIDELCGLCRAAYAAKTLRECRIGMVGGEFEGMGDFRVPDLRLSREIGFQTVRMTAEEGRAFSAAVSEQEIAEELADDAARYDVRVEDRTAYADAARAGLAVRRWMEAEKLDGVTVNFLHADEAGLAKMPFVECCKVLERGQGYAGEGDNLTAALVAALIRTWPDTTFTEMFCPDWERDLILMSHMGELNPRLTAWKPVAVDKPFNYNSCGDTVALSGCFRAGQAVLVNLAPMAESFSLILSEVELTGDGTPDGAYADSVQGWLKPARPLADFLKAYSLAGGTHHSALVYGAKLCELAAFGRMMGFETVIL